MASLVWLMLLGYFTFVSSQNPSPIQPNNIFILAGQSNMVGRGDIIDNSWDGYVPPESKSSPNILRFNSKLAWEEAQEPLHNGIDLKVAGIGPGMPFANRVLKKIPDSAVIGLIPCAIGATSLKEWSKGAKLYNDMIRRTRAATRDGGVIQALLWFQGEADTGNITEARTYKTRFEQFVTDVRSELGLPNLPTVQVALPAKTGKYLDVVRKCQLGVTLPNVKTIDPMGQPLSWDSVHLTTNGAIHVGQMLADAFLQFPAISYA